MALDPRNQAVIVSDKGLNAVLTFHVPELFGGAGLGARPGATADRVALVQDTPIPSISKDFTFSVRAK